MAFQPILFSGFTIGGTSGGGGGGSVTSVGLTAPSIFTVSNSPVVTSGSLTFSLNVQSGNVVFASPANGSSGTPTFRSLVSADIPIISLPSGVSGILPVLTGGTGISSSGSTGNVLTSNGSSWITQVQNYNIYEVTLNSSQIIAKSVTLPATPIAPTNTRLVVIGGPEQSYNVDFTVSGSSLSWASLGLDGILAISDQLIITYN